jgi:hypothetical protein
LVIDAVLLFGALNVLFEFVLLSMVPPRWRLRLLGSAYACGLLHVGFLLLNLTVHWGTLVGSMASILAFVSSIVTVEVARRLFGVIKDGRFYTVGFFRYPAEELA